MTVSFKPDGGIVVELVDELDVAPCRVGLEDLLGLVGLAFNVLDEEEPRRTSIITDFRNSSDLLPTVCKLKLVNLIFSRRLITIQ